MTAQRTITAAARDLQSAANRLALMTRNHNRDTILAGLYGEAPKGLAAAARLAAQAPAMKALEEEVQALREELGTMLDAITPEGVQLEPWQVDVMANVVTEPPTKKRKKRK